MSTPSLFIARSYLHDQFSVQLTALQTTPTSLAEVI